MPKAGLPLATRGGGHKRKYRIIDFKRNKDGVPAKVAAIEYDPNRTARIALLHYLDGESATFSLLWALALETWLNLARKRTSSLATLCLWRTSLLEPSFHTSNFNQAKAASWFAQQAARLS